MIRSFNEDQQKAINWYKGPMLVLGTPGSGKTTVITERIKKLINEYKVSPEKILVITFTRAAAQSMKQRFQKTEKNANVRFGTFHSFFFWIVKTAYGYKNEDILSEDERRNYIRELLTGMNLRYEDNEELTGSILKQIEKVDSELIDIENYYSHDLPEYHFRSLYLKFAELKKSRGKLDFNDMMHLSYHLLQEREDILNIIRKLYPFILVDEFQDTNILQYEILKMLAAPDNNLFVVGDDDQSIYGFRGARPDIMLSFREVFKGAEIVTLKVNYRSTADITRLSSRVIAHNKKRYSKELKAASKESGLIKVQQVKDISIQNDLIIKRIREALDTGTPANEIAVLYRTNMSPGRLIYKLREYNIPFTARDTVPDIFSNYMVSSVMDYMYFANGDRSRKRFLHFMNKPLRYVPRNILTDENVDIHSLIRITADKDYLQSNLMLLRNHLDKIRTLPTFAAINYIRKVVGFDEYISEYARERSIDENELFDIMDEFQSLSRDFDSFNDFALFSVEQRKMAEKETAHEAKDAVQLMTMHSSKGLEFTEVHIINCVEGEIPHKKSGREFEIEEERRMFYVAMTRAKEKLYIYTPRIIADKSAKISRFIKEMTEGE
ncbi:DNA helicase-2 / ATP-dependent DNA helicase PcrA [Eubacterium ruminantium]|nr:DNA helicase-2 / ATP-dependent DNA helicase PcrA [Eubacterium ruminantium]